MPSQLIELLFFAVLAAYIAYRLYKVLGQEDDLDPSKKSSLNLKPKPPGDANKGRIIDLEPSIETIPVTIPKPVAAILVAIQEKEAGFSVEHFISGARSAFEMIISAFSRGDVDTLRALVAPAVISPFIDDINERNKLGQTLETTLVSFVSCDIIDAKLEGAKAHITLKYITRQICILKNANGAIVSGSPSEVSRLEDIWTFERSLGSRDPNWMLIATNS